MDHKLSPQSEKGGGKAAGRPSIWSVGIEALGLYLQRNHKDGHFNSLRGSSRPARSMKGETEKLVLRPPNCAIMDFEWQS